MAFLALAAPFRRSARMLRRLLPPLNFITIHYTYFTVTCLVSAVILWSADPGRHLSFVDALFLAVSAMTLAGLNTINLSTLNTFQQLWLLLLIIIGSAVLVSGLVVHVRKRAFETKFKAVVLQERQRQRHQRSRSRSRGASRYRQAGGSDARDQDDLVETDERGSRTPADVQCAEKDATSEAVAEGPISPRSNLSFGPDTIFCHGETTRAKKERPSRGLWSAQGVGARPDASLDLHVPPRDLCHITSGPPENSSNTDQYFKSMRGWIGRNSEFHGLVDRERERLGGYEYRAVCFLAWLVPVYFILMQLLGCLGCAGWIAYNRPDTTISNGLNPWWVGAFNAVSAFNNSGMSLLDANMTAFQTGYYLLITMGFLILAGNTCYPIFLRLIIWSFYKGVQYMAESTGAELWKEREKMLQFLLDHPRRCYTNLFPAKHTWWLFASVITLNAIDWIGFEVLNINNKAIAALPVGVRVMDGLFQAFAVRSGGFYVVLIPTVRISLQVLYVVMMYISVYPVVITMRNSNVYEERSLGIYAEDYPVDDDRSHKHPGVLRRITRHFVSGGASSSESNSNFVRQQLRAQLAHDAWTIVLALFCVMIIESGQFERDPKNFSVFNFLFEIVSGYGCVGISLGTPDDAYSFCGTWHTSSQLILCAVMLRGRHRGLPVAIDRAVLLPGEETERAEEEDGRIRLQRTLSRARNSHSMRAQRPDV